MKLGISVLLVEDVEKAKDFYVGKLGFNFIPQITSDTFLSLKPENDVLIGIQDVKTFDNLDAEKFRTGSSELGFEVLNVDKEWERLISLDIKISEIYDKPFGRVFYLNDPEGHNLSFYQPSF